MNLEDIARLAGVSRSTVSRVINNDPKVKGETRDRIMQVIREQHFQPNIAARTLVTQRTGVIGVVIPSPENIFFTDNNYFSLMLAGLSQTTRERDYAMLLWLGQVADNDERLMQKIANHHLMDGLVIASLTRDHPLYKRLNELRRPYVMIDKPFGSTEQVSFVSIDNVQGGEVATSHLIEVGRRRIAHFTGHMSITDAMERLQGYRNALKAADHPTDEQFIFNGEFRRQSGYVGFREMFSRPKDRRPDAIFAASDIVAMGIVQAAHEMGVRIPDDVAVIGFDDVDVASSITPPLSTVRQPVQYKGEVAARLLLDLIEGKVQSPQHVLLPTELVIRESTIGKASSQLDSLAHTAVQSLVQ